MEEDYGNQNYTFLELMLQQQHLDQAIDAFIAVGKELGVIQ